MPVIRRWFDTPKTAAWAALSESPWSEIKGGQFFSYPLTWLLPYVDIDTETISNAPTPLWITDIAPHSQFGVVCEKEEGTFVINLPENFECYISGLEAGYRKKYRAILRKNEDIVVKEDSASDLEILWPYYIERLNELAQKAGAEAYTDEELAVRKEFYTGKRVHSLSFYLEGELVGINLSFWEEHVVYDLACIIKPAAHVFKRSIGALAILKNVEIAIRRGMKRYDLLSRDYGYKRSFGAHEEKVRCIIVCSREFAIEYDIPGDLYVEDVRMIKGFSE